MSALSGLGRRLYRGETRFDFIGTRKIWYVTAGALVLLSVLAVLVIRFNLGIEFRGGAEFRFPAQGTSVEEAREITEGIEGLNDPTVQSVGDDIRVQTGALEGDAEVTRVQEALASELDLPVDQVTASQVGAAWGSQVTTKAVQGLVVFLVAVIVYLSFRFEPKMAIAAIAALLHDLMLTAGVYAVLGFEVTPGTVIGLLTILGYSLYDTVIVFDKVQENTRGIAGGTRSTYSQAANLAMNQVLARSINTSLIALLPVAGLLFIGAGLLGAGTLLDLSLVLFVGILAGTYSSIFIATPILADLKEREPQYQALRHRIESRQGRQASRPGRLQGAAATAGAAPTASAATAVLDKPGPEPADDVDVDDQPLAVDETVETDGGSVAVPTGTTPDGTAPTGAPRARGGRSAPPPRRRKGSRPGRPSGKRRR